MTTPSSADERALFEAADLLTHGETESSAQYRSKQDRLVGWMMARASLGAAQVPSLSDAQSRVAAFLAEYAKRRGLHPEEIYSLGLDDGALVLLASDLAALSQPSQQEPTK